MRSTRGIAWLACDVGRYCGLFATIFVLGVLCGCGSKAGPTAAAPFAVLSTENLSFSSVMLGSAGGSGAVTLTNTGGRPLVLGAAALTDTADFAVATTCGATLAVDGSCAYTVEFRPQAAAQVSGTLVLTDDSGGASGAQQVIALSGTGTPVPVAHAVLAPVSVVFDGTSVRSSTPPQVVTLSNPGTAPLAMGSVAVADGTDFSVSSGCGSELAAGASCAISVVFQPQSAGPLATTLTVTDNDGGVSGAQQTVSVRGTGIALPAPQVVLTPAALTFGQTMLTTSSAAQSVVLTNAGNAALTLSGVGLSDSQNFKVSSNCGATVAAGASCGVSVVFQPQGVGVVHAALSLTDNSGDAGGTMQQTVSLAGEGVAFAGPRAVVSPATLTFPQIVTNSSASAQTVTLTNTGTAALQVSGVAIGGANAAAFQVASGSCGGALAAGASCTEAVVYRPTLASAGDGAALVFTDDALGQTGATQTVALAGTALAEVDSVTNFGDSLTCGFYAEPHDGAGRVWSLEGYAGLFDTWLGVPAQNVCRQGDTAADLSRLWVPWNSAPAAGANQLYTLMVGTNDAYRYGIAQSSLNTYAQEVGSALAWLAMPNADKVLGNAITQQSGAWAQDVGFGVSSSDANASLSFSVNQAVAGRNLYVVYHVWALPYGQAGKAAIAVDGVVQATVEESQNSYVNVPTENGTTDTFLLQTVPLGGVGPHTVTFTSTGPAGSQVGLLWAGVPQQDYRAVDGAPRVLLGLITNSPSGNQTYAADVYNLQLKSLVPALTADGLNVVLVPTDRVMDPGTDFADILHPNNSGHAKLAGAFEQYR